MQIEDQITEKRRSQDPDKILISIDEMQQRIKAAVSGRTYEEFAIIARTDAFAGEGLEASIDRANAYIEAGADMIFAEAMTDIDHYRAFAKAIDKPLIANLNEFGKTPLFNKGALGAAGVKIILYPLTAFHAMNKAALETYIALRKRGTQESLLPTMQTCDELNEILNHQQYQKTLDDPES